MNEVLKSLKERRSCRKFLPQQVRQQDLEAILEAGTYAPTGMNRQAPVIVAIQNPETLAQVSRLNAAVMGSDTDPFYGAPTVLVVLADPQVRTWLHDGALVMGNLLNAAHAIGLGSCWIDRAEPVFETEEGKALMKKWGVPEGYVGVGNCILGHTDVTPEPKPRKEGYIIYAE